MCSDLVFLVVPVPGLVDAVVVVVGAHLQLDREVRLQQQIVIITTVYLRASRVSQLFRY